MKKKKCNSCRKEISSDYKYCPYCGAKQKKTDSLLDEIENIFSETTEFGFFGGFNKIISRIAKQIEEEITKIDKEIKPIDPASMHDERKKPRGISIKINFDKGVPTLTISEFNKQDVLDKKNKEKRKTSLGKLITKVGKDINKMPREEAKTKIKRLGDSLIYEIELPGVKSIANVEIRKLENSVEIKAIGKDRIYFKLIPVSLPILKYELKKEKLYIYFSTEI